VVERCGRKLERVEKLYITYLKLQKPFAILRDNFDIVESDLFNFLVFFLGVFFLKCLIIK